MATERTTDIVLRAQVDKALQPLDQVLQRVKQLTTVLDQQRDAAKTGDTTLGEYAKALRDVENAAKDLLRARVALNSYQDKQETLAAKQQAVATARQARDTFAQQMPAEPTKAQERQLGSLEKALQRSEAQANTASRAFEKAAAEMERMQIAVDKLDQTHQQITLFRDMASDALLAGNAVNDTLIATLKVARAEKEANAQRIADREKLLQAIAKTNAGLRAEAEAAVAAGAKDEENKQRTLSRVNAGLTDLGAKQQAADAVEAAKVQEAADKKRTTDAEAAQNKARMIAQANVGFARMEAQERERAAQAEATLQEAADKRRVAALQEEENKARTLRRANVGFIQMETKAREDAIAQEMALQEAADKKRVADADAAAKAEGRAAKERGDLIQAVRNAETAAMRDDYKAAIAAEEALAKERKKNADDFQASQARLREAVASVWEAEAEDAQKAFAALDAYAASVAKVQAQAAEAMARARTQTAAVGAPVTLPATPLAESVRTALGTAPGAAAGGGTLAGLQSEIAGVTTAVTAGTGAVTHYADELKRLDAISRETVRQSQIIDSFQKQKEAARATLTAFHDLAEEIKRLEAEANKAQTPDQLAEVTSKITDARRRLGSVESGTGLAAKAREEIEAFEREVQALNAIGVATDRVTAAMRELTAVAVSTSAERQTIMAHEKANTDATVDGILANARRLAAISYAPPAPTATSQVMDVAGPGRGRQQIDDVTAATDKLTASLGKGRLTAQTYNKTMDELFAIQSQIASDASLIDQYSKQTDVIMKANAEFVKAEAEVKRLAAAVKGGTASLNELQQAESKLASTSTELQKQASAHAAIGAQMAKRRIDTVNLTGETDKLVQASARLAAAQNAVQQSSGKIFGLTSYQFQNLQFQVNDVITQLSLGQGLLRTFESQAGQIFQIFDLSAAALGRLVLIGGPAIAVILAIAASLLRLKEGVDAQREFNHQLALMADGSAYSGKALLEVARNIEAMGVSFTDAKDVVKTFVREGLNPEAMLRFGKAARDLADVTGIEFKDAFKQITVIATGTLDSIMKLNEQYNFLHDAEAKAIEDSFKFGNGIEGRAVAMRALTNALGNATREGIDPFTESMRELTKAWHDFLDAIASVGLFNAIAASLRAVATLAREIAADLKYIFGDNRERLTKEADARITDLTARLERVKALIDQLRKQGMAESDPTLKLLTEQAVELREKLDEARIAKYNLAQPVPGAGLAPGSPGSVGGAMPAGGGPLPPQFANLPSPDSRVSRGVPADIQTVISAVSAVTAVSENTLSALYRLEASRNADLSFNTSAAGARGPFQVMPGTFDEIVREFQGMFNQLATALGKKISIDTPEFNALAGALYFKKQVQTFGSEALGAAAYNMGPGSEAAGTGLRGVLAGRKSLPTETAQYVSNFLAPNQGTDAGIFTQPGMTNQDAIRQRKILEDLQRERINRINAQLRGEARLKADQDRVEQFTKDEREKLINQLQGKEPSPEVEAEFKAKIEAFRKQLEDLRLKEIQDANKAASDILKSAQDAVDKSRKTDPEAQRRVVDRAYDSQLEAIEIQIRQGATDIAKQSLEGAKAALLKARDEAREKATIETDRAIIDVIVKARDEAIKKIRDDFAKGALTVAQMYQELAKVTGAFAPKIKEAVERSNADLLRQPQTPAIQEQLVKNRGVDRDASRQTGEIDKSAEARRSDLLKTRSEIETAYQNLVTQGAISQKDANAIIEKSYEDIKPQIVAINEELLKQIELQKELGTIAPETYELMKAKILETTAAATGLTREQKKFQDQVSGVIANAAVNGLESIAESMGKVIAGTESWGDMLKDVGRAFAKFAADVLKGIAEIIIKEEILALIKLAFAAAHGGGIAGSTGMTRSGISPLVFLGAPRMHNGGLAGDEVATILKRGEEVLPMNDPRHRNNLMNGGSTEVTSNGPNIKNVLVMDPADLSKAMSGAHGEKVILTHLKNNPSTVRGIIGAR
jgi:hypothetical protein